MEDQKITNLRILIFFGIFLMIIGLIGPWYSYSYEPEEYDSYYDKYEFNGFYTYYHYEDYYVVENSFNEITPMSLLISWPFLLCIYLSLFSVITFRFKFPLLIPIVTTSEICSYIILLAIIGQINRIGWGIPFLFIGNAFVFIGLPGLRDKLKETIMGSLGSTSENTISLVQVAEKTGFSKVAVKDMVKYLLTKDKIGGHLDGPNLMYYKISPFVSPVSSGPQIQSIPLTEEVEQKVMEEDISQPPVTSEETEREEDISTQITPDEETIPPTENIGIKSAISYKGAKVVYKVKVENNSKEPIARIRAKLYLSDNVFILDKDEKGLDLLQPEESATVTFNLRPKGECGNVGISGKVVYYDYKIKEYKELKIESKTTAIICPMMKVVQTDEDSWRDNVSRMIKVEETTEEIPIEAKALFDVVVDVVRDINCYMLEPKITDASGMFRGVGRFYCEGVKGLKYAIHVEVIGGKTKSKLILKAFAENEESLIGFYHCILDEIEKRTKIKEYIHDALIVHGDYVTGEKIEVRDSVVSRSSIKGDKKD